MLRFIFTITGLHQSPVVHNRTTISASITKSTSNPTLFSSNNSEKEVHACQGSVHRDLESSNVLVGSSGAVKLADHGTSFSVDEASGSPSEDMSGTFGYLFLVQTVADTSFARLSSPMTSYTSRQCDYAVRQSAPSPTTVEVGSKCTNTKWPQRPSLSRGACVPHILLTLPNARVTLEHITF